MHVNASCNFLLHRIADAEENLGESEVRKAHLAKSLFYIRINGKVMFAVSFYDFMNLVDKCKFSVLFLLIPIYFI